MENKYDIEKDMRYLRLLSKSFPTVAEASTEIINLQAILHLPKATEHFLADLHGEYQAFQHVLKNASGNIKRKVNELFGISCVRPRNASYAHSSITQSKIRARERHRARHQRLVPHHHSPFGSCLSHSVEQIHTLQSTQVSTQRFFLHHPRIA